MSAIASTGFRVNPDWFTIKNGAGNVRIGVLKSEYREDFAAALKESRQKSKAEFMADAEANGTEVKLSEAQKKELAEKYDPENMTQEEYDEFIDDLCEYGVLMEKDKGVVGAASTPGGVQLVPIDSIETVQILSGKDFSGAYCPISIGDANGNLLNWAKIMGSFQALDVFSGAFTKSRSAILFGKIEDVLEQMSAVEKDSKG